MSHALLSSSAASTSPTLRPDNPGPLRHFIRQLSQLLHATNDEATLLQHGTTLLRELVSHDDWLPDLLAQPDPWRYQQFLLYADPDERFSVVSFVWGPGQATPIHDHTVWGLIGMLRGAEYSQPYQRGADGRWHPQGAAVRLEPGQVEAVSPAIGDVHQVRNAFADRTSISIHVYGANIGRVSRSVYRDDGSAVPFISGYSNRWLPNLWDNPAP